MRLHYYQFPEGVPPHTRYQNGAVNIRGDCDTGREDCKGCPHNPGAGWWECPRFICLEAEDIISGTSITEAKRLLKEFGGRAWTEHCERDGGVFEVTDITLKGNNSRFKYNRHL